MELVIKDILLNHGVIFENHFYVSPLVSFITLILYLLLASIISVLPMKIINKVSMNEIISEDWRWLIENKRLYKVSHTKLKIKK